jgi:hypothetical protein
MNVYLVAVTDVVLVAIIGVIGILASSVIAPYVLARASRRDQKASKMEDWERQDEVASRAADVAAKLLDSNERAVHAVEAAALVAEQTNGTVNVIHTLVNSNMTEAKQEALDAKRETLVMLRSVTAGREATAEEAAAMAAIENKIVELEAQLAERLRQQQLVDAQQAAR